MTATREHLAGLELAHKTIAPYSSWCGEQLRLLVEQAKSSPEPVQGEAVHWRALLDPAEIQSQLNTHMHVVDFTDRRAAEDWVAAKLSIDGWNYRLEALYTAAARPDAELVELLVLLRKMVNATPLNDIDRAGVWFSTKHPLIKRIDAKLHALPAEGGDQ